MIEAHAEHGVAGLEQARYTAMLALAPACGCTLACSAPNSAFARSMASVLDLVDDLVAAVVALARDSPPQYLLVRTEPVASSTAGEAKFSDGDELQRRVLTLDTRAR